MFNWDRENFTRLLSLPRVCYPFLSFFTDQNARMSLWVAKWKKTSKHERETMFISSITLSQARFLCQQGSARVVEYMFWVVAETGGESLSQPVVRRVAAPCCYLCLSVVVPRASLPPSLTLSQFFPSFSKVNPPTSSCGKNHVLQQPIAPGKKSLWPRHPSLSLPLCIWNKKQLNMVEQGGSTEAPLWTPLPASADLLLVVVVCFSQPRPREPRPSFCVIIFDQRCTHETR